MAVKRKSEDDRLDADVKIIMQDIKQALLIMTPVENEAWKYIPNLTREFTQKDYEIIRNLLLAYQQTLQ